MANSGSIFQPKKAKDLKPGMLIWCKNPYTLEIGEFFGHKRSAGPSTLRTQKPYHIVLDVTDKYVLALMMSSFIKAECPEAKGIPEYGRKYLVRVDAKKIEKGMDKDQIYPKTDLGSMNFRCYSNTQTVREEWVTAFRTLWILCHSKFS